jgi:hypothetical protein
MCHVIRTGGVIVAILCLPRVVCFMRHLFHEGIQTNRYIFGAPPPMYCIVTNELHLC